MRSTDSRDLEVPPPWPALPSGFIEASQKIESHLANFRYDSHSHSSRFLMDFIRSDIAFVGYALSRRFSMYPVPYSIEAMSSVLRIRTGNGPISLIHIDRAWMLA